VMSMHEKRSFVKTMWQRQVLNALTIFTTFWDLLNGEDGAELAMVAS